jgi:hypothetical protein
MSDQFSVEGISPLFFSVRIRSDYGSDGPLTSFSSLHSSFSWTGFYDEFFEHKPIGL